MYMQFKCSNVTSLRIFFQQQEVKSSYLTPFQKSPGQLCTCSLAKPLIWTELNMNSLICLPLLLIQFQLPNNLVLVRKHWISAEIIQLSQEKMLCIQRSPLACSESFPGPIAINAQHSNTVCSVMCNPESMVFINLYLKSPVCVLFSVQKFTIISFILKFDEAFPTNLLKQ